MLTHIQALSQLIIRWRRLELHSWPHVFAMKRQEFDSKAAVHWFTFFDTCAKMRAGEFNADAFAAFVSDFMWGSNIGQLPARLSMLRAFGQQLLVHDAPSAYDDRAALMCRQSGALLLHLHGYFSHFVPAINEHEKSQTEPLTQELEDFVRIMKWQDANYYAVRASTEKSHLTIARVLSELDEVLCQPIRPIITKSEECITEDTSMGIAAEHSIVAKERKKLESKEKLARKKRRQEQLKQQARKSRLERKSRRASSSRPRTPTRSRRPMSMRPRTTRTRQPASSRAARRGSRRSACATSPPTWCTTSRRCKRTASRRRARRGA
jgi:midasin